MPLYLVLPRHSDAASLVARAVRENWSQWGPNCIELLEPGDKALARLAAVTGPIRGIIGCFSRPEQEHRLAHLAVPRVNLSNHAATSTMIRVIPDDLAIGRLAAEHLIEQGYRHFAFVGRAGCHYSRLRFEGLLGTTARIPAAPQETTIERLDAAWLLDLLRPAGIVACDDVVATKVVELALSAGLLLPQDVGVVGADNDELQCHLSRVPLSSVDTNVLGVARAACGAIARLGAGIEVAQTVRVPPLEVVRRLSTDAAGTNPAVAAAARYIRDFACEGITVDDVVRQVNVSRSTLQRQFMRVFSRTLHDELRRTRIARAQQLLRETRLKVSLVGVRCGYPDLSRFSREFRKAVGMSPAQWRAQYSPCAAQDEDGQPRAATLPFPTLGPRGGGRQRRRGTPTTDDG